MSIRWVVVCRVWAAVCSILFLQKDLILWKTFFSSFRCIQSSPVPAEGFISSEELSSVPFAASNHLLFLEQDLFLQKNFLQFLSLHPIISCSCRRIYFFRRTFFSSFRCIQTSPVPGAGFISSEELSSVPFATSNHLLFLQKDLFLQKNFLQFLSLHLIISCSWSRIYFFRRTFFSSVRCTQSSPVPAEGFISSEELLQFLSLHPIISCSCRRIYFFRRTFFSSFRCIQSSPVLGAGFISSEELSSVPFAASNHLLFLQKDLFLQKNFLQFLSLHPIISCSCRRIYFFRRTFFSSFRYIQSSPVPAEGFISSEELSSVPFAASNHLLFLQKDLFLQKNFLQFLSLHPIISCSWSRIYFFRRTFFSSVRCIQTSPVPGAGFISSEELSSVPFAASNHLLFLEQDLFLQKNFLQFRSLHPIISCSCRRIYFFRRTSSVPFAASNHLLFLQKDLFLQKNFFSSVRCTQSSPVPAEGFISSKELLQFRSLHPIVSGSCSTSDDEIHFREQIGKFCIEICIGIARVSKYLLHRLGATNEIKTF